MKTKLYTLAFLLCCMVAATQAKNPYVVIESESTRPNDPWNIGSDTGIHGEYIAHLSKGKRISGNCGTAKDNHPSVTVASGKNDNRVIWKQKNATLVLGLGGQRVNKLKFLGIICNEGNRSGSWGGIRADIQYQTADNPNWRTVTGRNNNTEMWFEHELTFDAIANCTKLKIDMTGCGSWIGMSGINLHGGYSGNIITETNDPTHADENVLYWRAYNQNGALIGTDNGTTTAHDAYNANYDGVRNFWMDKRAEHKYIRFVMFFNNTELQTCDAIGSANFVIGDGEHLVLENLGMAPIGVRRNESNGQSFYEITGNGKITIGPNIYAFIDGNNNQVSANNSGYATMDFWLQGILGEYRPSSSHALWIQTGRTINVNQVVGYEKVGAYEGVRSGEGTQVNHTYYNVFLDPTGANLLKNGGFEDNAMWQRGGATARCGFDGRARTGTHSLNIQGISSNVETTAASKDNNKVDLKQNNAYYFRVYGYQESKVGEKVQVYFKIEEPYFGATNLKTAGQWQLYSWRKSSHTTNSSSFGMQNIRLDYDNNKQNGEIWYDDFAIINLTEYAQRHGMNVNDLTQEWCDTHFAGEGMGEQMLRVKGGTAMPTITPPPARAGFTFCGYYDGLYGTGNKYYNADGTSARNYDKNVAAMLYAKWVPTNSPLTLNLNGGTYQGTTGTKTFAADPTGKIDLAMPTRHGYYFTGWSGNGERNLTRAQAQYGTDNRATAAANNGDQFLSGAMPYEMYDSRIASLDKEINIADKKNNAITLGRRYLHTNSMTINIWGYSDNWATFPGKRLFSTTESGGWNLEDDGSGNIRFALHPGSYVHINAGRTFASLGTNSWHMFTLVFDDENKKARGYIDGAFVGEIAKNQAITYNTGVTVILGGEAGAYRRIDGYIHNGKIKNFGIVNWPLTSAEIADLYANPNTTHYYLTNDANQSLTANWTPNNYFIKYNAGDGEYSELPNIEYQYADMTQWVKDGTNSNFVNNGGTISYNSGNKTNSITMPGGGGFENIYKEITVEPNQIYELSINYTKNASGYYDEYNYIPLQVLTAEPTGSKNEDKELNYGCRIHLYNGSESTSVRFNVGNRNRIWLNVNGGFAANGTTHNFTISNIRLRKLTAFDRPYGELHTPTKAGETFGGWYTDPACLPTQKVTATTIVTNPSAHTLYAQWAVCSIGDQDYKTLQDAIDFAQEGETIELIKDITEDVVIDKPIGIVGNNHTLTGNIQITPDGAVEMHSNLTVTGKLTLENEGVDGNKKSGTVKGQLTVQNHVEYKMNMNIASASDLATHTYWISLPYPAAVSDITGPQLTDRQGSSFDFQSVYQGAWVIRRYNTEARDRNTQPLGQMSFYEDISPSEVMQPKQGYVLQFAPMAFGEISVTFPSQEAIVTLNTADTSGKYLENYGINNPTHSHWWLVGQPYFTPTLIADDGPQFVAKMLGGNDHFDYYLWYESEMLNPYESYFVQYTGTMHFQNPAALTPKMASKEPYVMTLSKGNMSRKMGVVLASDASSNFKVGRDMPPMDNDPKLQFYSKSKGNNLIFTELTKGSQDVSLGYKAAENGEYTIELTSLDKIPAEASVVLEDKNTGEFINLRGNKHTFNTASGTFDNRFVLHINKATTEIVTTQGDHVLVINHANAIEVSNLNAGTDIALYHVSGKLIDKQTAISNSLTFSNLASGIYLLTINNEPVKVTLK